MWAAFGCALNLEDYQPTVRAAMWEQIISMAEESYRRSSRVYRENQQLERELAALRAPEPDKPRRTVACPHWSPGRITMRTGCTACAAAEPDEREEEENQMTQRAVVEAKASQDEAGRQPLPRLIGPFADREAAEAYMAAIGPLWGSWSVVPLTEPNVEGSDR